MYNILFPCASCSRICSFTGERLHKTLSSSHRLEPTHEEFFWTSKRQISFGANNWLLYETWVSISRCGCGKPYIHVDCGPMAQRHDHSLGGRFAIPRLSRSSRMSSRGCSLCVRSIKAFAALRARRRAKTRCLLEMRRPSGRP